ncbi:aspartate aminotransferase family protein [Microbacterium protaetiae]|uniref:Aspartate aminotransferase family protein n=1 Tax=Microbacterium protaetiae TaxID=2509458 RepID=A0A4P6EDR0_9MICO|nr:aminotransferase class V-fold PLP-dependent enzyme [Microbacterium protaetiae]QAY60402.1 aspartate aminotransferase family protein [Microbacterium protaetiae]
MTFDDAAILAELDTLRAADAPTHGGRVLSYVYDSGMPQLDALAADAARRMQAVNGLDPTTFTSVAALERDVLAFARDILGGEAGTVTSGGTESCLLAVKTASDLWRAAGGAGVGRIVAPTTAHAAFRKAAELFDLRFDGVPVDPATGTVEAAQLIDRLGDDVALVVVSAPSYPFAAMDPIADVAAACAASGISCHVDACIGGWILPFWPQDLPAWDLRVPGVTSLSADLHKYGYAPKGVSVLLHSTRDRQRAQYFATTDWPGYPVVNPTLLGSKSAGALAAAWAIIKALGAEGFASLARTTSATTQALTAAIAGIEGLRVVGRPTGPLLAVATDEQAAPERRVDPHHWADAARAAGWMLQQQPGLTQADGIHLPPTTHLTVTPVTDAEALVAALVAAADAVRGVPPVDAAQVLGALPAQLPERLDADAAGVLLAGIGLGGEGGLPAQMAPFLALVEALPHQVVERLLVELLARTVES